MSTPEKKVKDKVKAILKELGAYYFMPATHGFGSSGVPDIVACLDSIFIGIECKAGTNKPTALQVKNLNEIAKSGGLALCVNEKGIAALKDIIENYSGGIYMELMN